jgi:hypothetical protein
MWGKHYIFKYREEYDSAEHRNIESFEPYFIDETSLIEIEDVKDVWNGASLTELLQNIPYEEQFNLHISLWTTRLDKKTLPKSQKITNRHGKTYEYSKEKHYWKRECDVLPVLAWDIDDVPELEIEQTINHTLSALSISREQIGIVASGNGIHIILPLKNALSKADVQKLKKNYETSCRLIEQVLFKAQLNGKVDFQTFIENKTLRLPNTRNIKKNLENLDVVKPCVLLKDIPKVLQDNLLKNMLDSAQFNDEHVQVLRKIQPQDAGAIEEGCSFFKWAKNNQKDVSEPQWYALIGALAFMPEGEHLCHTYSENHPNYNKSQTKAKYDQARRCSGPRTCKSIEQVYEGCSECPFYNKVKTPL